LNEDYDIVYIPNNKVFSSEIINYTLRELKKSSVDFEVDPLIVTDLDAFEKRLIAMLYPYSEEIQAGTYNLKTVSVKKDCLTLKFQFVLNEPLNKELDKKIRKFFIRQLVLILGSGQEM
ncbi:MAG: mechanosensitive ion channel protein MscS, partial [Crocinitomicaceae bacterium]|nr:mechanosensitive ion channel protein MscS [Crocinitomicaceae bacterium]